MAKTIADLKQDRSNPRKHNARNLQVIVDSLNDVGFARSIVIDENDEILAGNGVTEAAALAGIDKVVEVEADGNTIIAVRRRGLTDEQKQRLKYFDNRSGELAEWNTEQLLADIGAGVDLSSMFRDDEVDRLLGNISEVDVNAEWQGMPEFKQEDLTGIKCVVHFENESDKRAFEKLVGQKIPDNTKAIWYPQKEWADMKSLRYEHEA